MFEPSDFDWDEAKATSNFSKHGFGFHEAVCIFSKISGAASGT
jgi:uncharacterized DUF497 family protein